MLKGGLSLRLKSLPARSAPRRRLRRVARARILQKATTAADPRLRRVFDNVDGGPSVQDKRSLQQQEPPTPVASPDDARDWTEDSEQTNTDWGGAEKSNGSVEEGDAPEDGFRNEGTSYYKASSISVLTEGEKEEVLPLVPIGSQASFYAPREFAAKLTWWGAALCGCVLFANSATWIAALSLSSPILVPWFLAGARNWELQSNGKVAFMGIWHCQVLASEMLDAHAPSSQGAQSGTRNSGSSLQKMIRLLIGDPWNGGARTEMVVPLKTTEEVPNVGELCDLLVLSKFSDFRDFKAVREAFFPRTRVWLAEYPFINRESFYRLICDIQRRQNEIIMDQDHW